MDSDNQGKVWKNIQWIDAPVSVWSHDSLKFSILCFVFFACDLHIPHNGSYPTSSDDYQVLL